MAKGKSGLSMAGFMRPSSTPVPGVQQRKIEDNIVEAQEKPIEATVATEAPSVVKAPEAAPEPSPAISEAIPPAKPAVAEQEDKGEKFALTVSPQTPRKRGRPKNSRTEDEYRPSFGLRPETYTKFKIYLLMRGLSVQDYLEQHVEELVKDIQLPK